MAVYAHSISTQEDHECRVILAYNRDPVPKAETEVSKTAQQAEMHEVSYPEASPKNSKRLGP